MGLGRGRYKNTSVHITQASSLPSCPLLCAPAPPCPVSSTPPVLTPTGPPSSRAVFAVRLWFRLHFYPWVGEFPEAPRNTLGSARSPPGALVAVGSNCPAETETVTPARHFKGMRTWRGQRQPGPPSWKPSFGPPGEALSPREAAQSCRDGKQNGGWGRGMNCGGGGAAPPLP